MIKPEPPNPLLTREGRQKHIESDNCELCTAMWEQTGDLAAKMAKHCEDAPLNISIHAAMVTLISMIDQLVEHSPHDSSPRQLREIVMYFKAQLMDATIIENHELQHDYTEKKMNDLGVPESVKQFVHNELEKKLRGE